jgi:hypothetical protein
MIFVLSWLGVFLQDGWLVVNAPDRSKCQQNQSPVKMV